VKLVLALAIQVFLVFIVVAAQRAPEQGVIEGLVLRVDDGRPVAGARIVLTQRPPALTSTFSTTTNANGEFFFPNLGPGTYSLFASADGFADRGYGQSRLLAPGMPIALAPNQHFTHAVISLTPLGAVVGRVLDEDSGQPLVDVPVRLYRPVYGPVGRYHSVIAKGSTNDRGEYRLYGIPSGQYYLGLGTDGTEIPPILPVERATRTPPMPKSFDLRFFPGVRNIEAAAPVEVRPGPELSLDMKTSRRPGHSIRGLVTDSAAGRAPEKVQIYLVQEGTFRSNFPWQRYDASTGQFELWNVAAGSYTLLVQNQTVDSVAKTAGEAAWSMRMTAWAPVRVVDADVDELRLHLYRPAAVAGRVRFEAPQSQSLPAGISLRLTPIGATAWAPPTAFVRGDGTFRADGLLEGEYLARLNFQQPGFYVKSIQYQGADILNSPWRFSGTAQSGEIEILLGQGTGELTGTVTTALAQPGTVTTALAQPLPGAQVLLIPERRSREDLYILVVSDQYGRFSFSNLPPGDYKLFAWDADAEVDRYNPGYMDRFEHLGRMIRVSGSSTVNMDLRVIANPTR
jgi:hypothetical protein